MIGGLRSAALTNLWVGLVLLPFSTSPQEGAVIAYGLPFVAFAIFLGFCDIFLRGVPTRVAVSPLEGLAILYGIGVIISVLWTSEHWPSLFRAATQFLGILSFLYVVRVSRDDPTILYKTLIAIVICGVVLSTYYILNLSYAIANYGLLSVLLQRYVGGLMALPWGASNVIAACILISLIALVVVGYLGLVRPSLTVIGGALMVFAVALTLSRSVIALTLLFLLASQVLVVRKIGVKWVVVVAAVLGVGVVLVAGVQNEVIEKLIEVRLRNTDSIATLNSRIYLWARTLDYFETYPFSPLGYYGTMREFGYTSHSFYLTQLIEQGPVAVVLFLGLMLGVALSTFQNSRPRSENPLLARQSSRANTLLGVGVLALMGNFLLEDPYFTQQHAILFWLYLAVASRGVVVAPEVSVRRWMQQKSNG